jgi:hypothetical protein
MIKEYLKQKMDKVGMLITRGKDNKGDEEG